MSDTVEKQAVEQVPSKIHRWKPGESGNPKGRPKKGARFASALELELEAAHASGATLLSLVAKVLVAAALKGDIGAIREIADRLDGKARQSLEVTAVREIPPELLRAEAELTVEELRQIAKGEYNDDSPTSGPALGEADPTAPVPD